MSTPCWSLSLTGLTLLAFSPAIYADDNGASTLDAVVVTAEREPGNFALDRDEIELTQAGDLSNLLSNESGVAVGGGAAVAQKVYVRGFEDTLLNVTVDGAQQPAELYHHQTRVQIEPEFIKRIELDAGAGVATQGAGALTGALRVHTRDAFDLLRVDQDFGLLVKGVAGFNGEGSGKGVVAAYGRLGENMGVLATYVRHDGEDYDDGHGQRIEPTAFDHERGQLRLTGMRDAHRFDLSFERLDDSGTYYERPHMIGFSPRFVLSDHQMRRDTTSYRHRFDPDAETLDIEASAYRNVSRYANHRNTTGALYGRGEQTSTGIDLRNTARWQELELVTGIEQRRDRLQARQQATPSPYWGDTEQGVRLLAAYAQANWMPLPALRLSGGMRWDHYHHRVDAGVGAGNRNSQARFSPNLSVEWTPADSLSLRASWAQAFRGVTIREAFFSALYTHHGDLEGEQADNAEVGFAWHRNGWFLRGTAFRQHIDHFINAVHTGDVSAEWGRWANVGRAEVRGYEAEGGREWARWRIGAGMWNSSNRLNDRALNDADLGLGTGIGRTWTARLDWTPGDRARYGLRARRVEAEPNAIAADAPGKPAYAVADLLADWTLLDDERLRLGLAINNVFDRYYYDHATYGYHAGSRRYIGFPAMGREMRLSLTWKY